MDAETIAALGSVVGLSAVLLKLQKHQGTKKPVEPQRLDGMLLHHGTPDYQRIEALERELGMGEFAEPLEPEPPCLKHQVRAVGNDEIHSLSCACGMCQRVMRPQSFSREVREAEARAIHLHLDMLYKLPDTPQRREEIRRLQQVYEEARQRLGHGGETR